MNALNPSPNGQSFVDFYLKVSSSQHAEESLRISPENVYRVMARSNVGEVEEPTRLPFDHHQLENALPKVENALIISGPTTRRVLTEGRQGVVQAFGTTLFDTLLPNDVLELYDRTVLFADRDGHGVRLRLRIDPPELAAIPWEFIFDHRKRAFPGLSSSTPIVRDIGLNQPVTPITVDPPLRVLGMISSPPGLEQLDVENERKRVESALKGLRQRGLIDLRWMRGTSWRALSEEIRRGAFNVFHFVGHGGFDSKRDEGLIALTDDDGKPYFLPARELAMLLANERALRLVVLNSCDGARGSTLDVFSSTASILVHRGVTAVVAMQYEISDEAAVEFSRTFYEAIADGEPIDAAVGHGRMAIRLGISGSLEWATPVLYQRAPDGVLFRFTSTPPPSMNDEAPEDEAETPVDTAPDQRSEAEPASPTAPDHRTVEPVDGLTTLTTSNAQEERQVAVGAESPTGEELEPPLEARDDPDPPAPNPRTMPAWRPLMFVPAVGLLFIAVATTAMWAVAAASVALVAATVTELRMTRSPHAAAVGEASNGSRLIRCAGIVYLAGGAGALAAAALATAPSMSTVDDRLADRPFHQQAALVLGGASMALVGVGLLGRPRWLWRRQRLGHGGTFGLVLSASIAMLPIWAPEPVVPAEPPACDPALLGEAPSEVEIASRGSSDPAMFRGNLARTGLSSRPMESEPEVQALVTAEDQIWSSAAWSDGVVFIGSNDGFLHAVDVDTGQPLAGWPFDTKGIVYSSPVTAAGVVYFGSSAAGNGSGRIHAVDIETGEELEGWPISTSAPNVYGTPVLVGDKVYVGATDGYFYRIDATSGEYRRIPVGADMWSSPAIAAGVAIVGTGANSVVAIDLDKETVGWKVATSGPVTSSPAIARDTAYVGSDDGCVYALDIDNGNERWRFQTGDKVFSSPAVANGVVYVGSKDTYLYALDADTGKELWRFDTQGMIWSSPAVANGAVHFGSDDGRLYAVDAHTGKELWRVEINRRSFELPPMHGMPQVRSSPLVLGDRVVIGSFDGAVYLVDFDTTSPTSPQLASMATPLPGSPVPAASPVD